jgi:hypothetical protein
MMMTDELTVGTVGMSTGSIGSTVSSVGTQECSHVTGGQSTALPVAVTSAPPLPFCDVAVSQSNIEQRPNSPGIQLASGLTVSSCPRLFLREIFIKFRRTKHFCHEELSANSMSVKAEQGRTVYLIVSLHTDVRGK